MNGEQKFWLFIDLIIAIAVVTFSLGMSAIYANKTIEMAKMGYQAVVYQGSETAYYQKVK